MYSITKPRIDQRSLKCRGENCEYFGNAQWDLFCSKCYREKVMRERLAESKNYNVINQTFFNYNLYKCSKSIEKSSSSSQST